MKLLILLTLALGLFAQKTYAVPYSRDQVDFKFTPSYPVWNTFQQEIRATEGRREITWFNDFVEKVRFGGDFWISFEALDSKNTSPTYEDVEPGFTNARGNLFFDIELAKGLSTFFELYLSSEHHPEMWMRQGYLFLDSVPAYGSKALDDLMAYFNVKAGQMEINFGDWHLRRTENATAQKNPLIGNYLIDANTNEIGAEVQFGKGEFQALGAFTGGTTKEDLRLDNGFGWYFKGAWDKKYSPDNRIRLAASYYGTNHQNKTTISYLYSGNRSGSPYRGIYPTPTATGSWVTGTDSGQILPNITAKVDAWQVNLLYQIKGLEIFATYEIAADRDARVPTAVFGAPQAFTGNKEKWTQWAVDLVYRFNPQFHIAGRINQADRDSSYNPAVSPDNYSAKMWNVGFGYFIKNTTALVKIEYMNQKWENFLASDPYANYARYGYNAKGNGVTIEGTVTF